MTPSLVRNRILLTAAAGLLLSITASPAGMTDAEQVLRSMRTASTAITSFKAQMIVRKRSSAIGDISNERADVFYKHPARGGDKYRANYLNNGAVVAFDGENGILYQPRIKQALMASRASLAKQDGDFDFFTNFHNLNTVTLKARYNVAYLGEDRTESGNAAVLELVPKANPGARKIKWWVDETVWLPLKIEVREPDGDVQTFVLTNFEKNPVIADSYFKFKAPAGTDEIHR